MKQQTLAATATKRDVYLVTMNEIVPCRELCEVIEPHHPKASNGRPPVGLERLRALRTHACQAPPSQVDVGQAQRDGRGAAQPFGDFAHLS